MIVHVLTLFPGLFHAFTQESIVGRAVERNLLAVHLVNIRDFATDKHKVTDDRPFGGGPGMVLKPEPIFSAVEHTLARAERPDPKLILLTPQGRPFDQEKAIDLAGEEELVMLCGRYEGIDERVHMGFEWDEISLGDFVMSGGELAAMCIIEAVTRLMPGALGDEESASRDSFMDGLLGPPQYTRPRSFRDMEVPEVLLSGDHEAIRKWRRAQIEARTRLKRPDLTEHGENNK
jgi:tRNA (guanine37-N1)-methyltransferase